MEYRDLSRRQALGLVGTAAVVAAAPNRSSEPDEYPLYRARGTHRELGRQHGEQAIREIQAHVEVMCAGQKRSREQLRRRAAKFQPLFERHCPHLLEEIRGLAEGAKVTLEEAMACNIRGELRSAAAEGCTTYVIGRSGAAGGGIITGQNSDMTSEIIPLSYVLHLQPQGKPEVLLWTFGGMLGYHGMNSAGLAHFENALGGGPRNRFGLPHYPAERMMLECDRLDQAIDVLRKMPLASNANYVLCDGHGNIADVEATTAGTYVLPDQGAGYFAHTNHFVCPQYALPENFARSWADSFPRLERIDSLIKSHYGSIQVDDIKNFLSDHSGYPTSICRHNGDSRTVASMISEPALRRMHVAVGNPCQHRYVTYSM
jgi:isopenicillin-N N-acyltransferase-like protein